MNPVEITTGKSFKGLAAYLLHDAGRAATAERVGWAQSFNLDDASPDLAWRLMASTAMSADQLKEAAGIKKGKAAKNTAYHFSLNFNPKDEPSEEMQRAAVTSALKAFGLEKYQALAVAHRDTGHAHVHVMVNLIDPETGLSAASKQPNGQAAVLSNMQKKMSKWAGQFERDHGLVVTEGRLENANKRAQGEQVDAKRKPRNVYEQELTETTDRRDDFKKRQQADKARDLTAENRQMHEQHDGEWASLKASYRAEKDAIFQDHKQHSKLQLDEMKDANTRKWQALFMRQRSEKQDFDRGEKTAIGRIWHAAAVMRARALDGDLLGGFVAAFSAEERAAIIQRKHDIEAKKFATQIRKGFAERIADLNEELAGKNTQARHRFMVACDELKRDQAEAKAAMKERWRGYSAGRREALSKGRGRAVQQIQSRGIERGRGLEPN